MNAFIDTTKIWYFDYSGNFLNTFLPVIMKVKAGKLLIKIPNGVKGMTIEILSYDQKENADAFMKTHLNDENFKGEILERFETFIQKIAEIEIGA